MINILEIITGHTGVDHVTSADDASLYRSIFGAEDAVLNVGSQFEHTIISNNLIKIADGDLVIQGHQARIRTNDYEELVIDNGTPGMQRHDLIVARYEKDVVSGIESVQLAVVKGVAGATAVDPELTQDDITSGGALREFPLYRVKLNGINVGAVEKMFDTVSQDLKNLQLESGSNDDGYWIRYPDGTQLAWKKVTVSKSGGWVTGASEAYGIGTAPASFTSFQTTVTVGYFYHGSSSFSSFRANVYPISDTHGTIRIDSGMASATVIILNVFYIGRWK